ncbi:DNA polymerase family B-domain-containing protein [Fimicolochytrium jonesii]|uniref:DNA polymerase family B-domain-containing protein n=1 Tax=Fimicolochytrium jonesii TaxID=1396493 RepID=UPI0022FF1B11|nr:DNA polymerase family B-domain-containing protein [Fimicolochytrium jonesii]KAI8826187.1 DNA polymerase family B-domain-containing protein [Fimicolochytrium jonesii]
MSNRKAALQKLRNAKAAGVSALEAYKVDEPDKLDVYDEVTEEEYNAFRRRRMEEGGDFVVDDDGLGYVDYGQDEWASEHSSEESDEEDDKGKAGKGKRKRGKENDNKPAGGNIQNLFNQQARNPKPKPKVAPRTAISDATAKDLLGSIFEDLDNLDNEVDDHAAKRQKSERISNAFSAYVTSAQNPFAAYARGSRNTNAANPAVPKERTVTKTSEPQEDSSPPAFDMSDLQTQEPPQIDEDEVADLHSPEADTSAVETQAPALPAPVTVKVKALQTSTAKKPALSFAPKFAPKVDRVEAEARAESTVVSAPDNANCRGWMSLKDAIQVQNMEPSQSMTDAGSATQSGPAEFLEEDGSLRMFWFDAFDRDGVIYLFGKAQNKRDGSYASCCTIVNNMQRNLFVLPRARLLDDSGHETDINVTIPEVYREFDALRRQHHIKEFASAKVSRAYAFEVPDIPAESDYLKVVYPFSQPALPTGLSGKSFSKIFGTKTNALELFILKRKLMGPCWVEIKNPSMINRNVSWCKLEVNVADPKSISPLKDEQMSPTQKKAPPFVVMSLTLRTVMNHKKHVNEIVAASGLVYTNVNVDGVSAEQHPSRFTVMRQLNEIPLPAGFHDLLQQQPTRIEVPRNERGLLGFLIAQIHRSDPDIIVGHNFIDFDLDVLLHRMQACNVEHWSKIGRLRRTKWPKLQTGAGGTADSTFGERQIASGRLLCDTYRASQDLIRSKSYSLTQLAASQLNVDRPNIDYEKIPTYFWDAGKLMEMIQHCQFDGYLQAQLMFKLQILPLTKQLTNLAGNLWARTMTGARAERNEYLLLHEFHDKKFVVPDKTLPGAKIVVDQLQEGDDQPEPAKKAGASARRKPAYAGGLVLEPKKGFYDKYVLLLDFNSLYPSIIQEYNICFTTVERGRNTGGLVLGDDQLPDVPDPELPKGILPKLLGTLVDRRRVVKNLMKDPRATPTELAGYDIRQKALKLTANSMYGCLGFSHSRFYAKPLAILITAKGREILQATVDLAEHEHLEVIYGDTDSIMIHTNTDDLQQVKRIGNDFKKAVNKRYNLLEIEMDGFFQRMLLLKKKKYAAVAVEEKGGQLVTTLETKGLDLVRRDWCGLSHDVSGYVLNQIFSGASREEVIDNIHAHLRKVGLETRSGLIPIPKFVITKSLTKNPEEYADKNSQPHVQVALQMKAKGISARVGDTIPYVICIKDKDATGDGKSSTVNTAPTNLMAAKAYHPDDVANDASLRIDFEWYLANQVHPPIARLCSPIEDTDAGRLADCLGLDPSKYRNVGGGGAGGGAAADLDELYTLDSQLTDEERFKDVEKWCPRCRACGEMGEFMGCVRRVDDGTLTSSFACPHPTCGTRLSTASLIAQLSTAIRTHIQRYANAFLICDEQACATRTRSMGVYGERCLVPGCQGTVRFEYPDTRLYTQLKYFASLFETREGEKRVGGDRDLLAQFNTLIRQDAEPLTKLAAFTDRYLQKNARGFVDLRQVFGFLTISGSGNKTGAGTVGGVEGQVVAVNG